MTNSSTDKKTAALVAADLNQSGLGTRSRLADDLAGTAVLKRTLIRLGQVKGLAERIVFCPPGQKESLQTILDDPNVLLQELSSPLPIGPAIQRRKWALTSWRGGLHEATLFDEPAITEEMVLYARSRDIYTAVVVPAEAVLTDPELIDGLIEHHQQHDSLMRFTFTQAAPGLCGWAYRLDLYHELRLTGQRIGDLMNYDPDHTQGDQINQDSNFKVPQEICFSPFRYLADTQRSFDAMKKTLQGANGNQRNAVQTVRKMADVLRETDILPRELEVEINTERSLRLAGYPHGRSDLGRGAMTLEQFAKIVNDCREYDDICLTLGGFGEPLAHPQLLAIIEAAKQAGIFGINIETDGRLLNGKLAESLLASPVDTISIFLDANSPELYRQVKGEDGFEAVVKQMEEFAEQRKTRGDTGPKIVAHLVKTRQSLGEMEEFYDRWIRQCGCAVITGFNDFAGQIEDRSVMNMSPPRRFPCNRLSNCMMILADGRVSLCSQDFRGAHAVGNVFTSNVKEIWKSQAMERLRQAHRDGNYGVNPLCERCKDWFR